MHTLNAVLNLMGVSLYFIMSLLCGCYAIFKTKGFKEFLIYFALSLILIKVAFL
jgi:uncharacterized membrane protein YhdT